MLFQANIFIGSKEQEKQENPKQGTVWKGVLLKENELVIITKELTVFRLSNVIQPFLLGSNKANCSFK